MQIAGVVDEEDARVLVDCGVGHIGFPLGLSVHREDLTREATAGIIRLLPPSHNAVLITYLDNADEILTLTRYLRVTRVQLHGDIVPEELSRLRTDAPDLFVIKSIIVGRDPLSELEMLVSRFEPHVNMFITDTYDPITGATGATGLTHNWDESKALVEASNRPVMLAGGLTAQNVAEAICHVRPAGVDSHTGVEDAIGRKSRDLVTAFISHARSAFASLGEGA